MLIDRRKSHTRAVHLTRSDFEALLNEVSHLPISKTPMAMSFAPGAAEKPRLYIFTDSGTELCFVEAHPTKPNFWHSASKHLCTRLTDNNIEVLVSKTAKNLIGDTYLQRILDTVGNPMLPEHVVY
jgi:hypothetical protein